MVNTWGLIFKAMTSLVCRSGRTATEQLFLQNVLLPTKLMPGNREVRHAVSVLDGSAVCDLGCVHASRAQARLTRNGQHDN